MDNIYSDFNLVINVGGCGGLFASVLAWGVTGQQQHGSVFSALEIVLGGAEGGERSFGGATNPGSSEPSPAAKAVPKHNVAAIVGIVYLTILLIGLYFCIAVSLLLE